jgi:hypothetical protein
MSISKRRVLRMQAALVLALLLCSLLPGGAISARAQISIQPVEPTPPPVTGADAQEVQSPEIIGGRPAAPGAWPWQVALVFRPANNAYNGFFCGGSLIAPDWVLTAAHCLDGTDVSLIDVLVGTHLLSHNERRIQADLALIHPDYSDLTLDGDLGLLRLSKPVTNTTIPIFAPGVDGDELTHLRGTVTGWGNMNPFTWFGEFPDALQEVALPLIGYEACRSLWGLPFSDKQICAGYSVMNKAVCNGDSGGPLMVQKPDGQWRQIGIVSAGEAGCAGGLLPDIFTRAGAYKGWIDACMQNPAAPACMGADTYEPDDRAAAAQTYATFGVTQTHTFHQPGDQDWLKFTVKAGALYQIRTQHVVTWTAPVDTLVWLFDDEGRTPLTYNDDYVDNPDFPLLDTVLDDSGLIWLAQADGELYVSVENDPSIYETERAYGPNFKYSLAIVEYPHQAWLPAVGSSMTAEITDTVPPPFLALP